MTSTLTSCTSGSTGGSPTTAVPGTSPTPAPTASQVWDPIRSSFISGRPAAAAIPSKISWDFDIREKVTTAVAGPSGIFADFPDHLVNYDPSSGKEAWKVNLPKLNGTRPADTTDFLHLVSTATATYVHLTRPLPNPDPENGNLYEQLDVFDAPSGSFLWGRSNIPDINVPPLPLHDDVIGLAIIRTDDENYGTIGGIEAIEAATGKSVWKNTEVGFCVRAADTILCNGNEPLTLASLEPRTGKILWTAPLPTTPDVHPSSDAVSAFTSIVGDTIVSGVQPGSLAAFDRVSGEPRWTTPLPFEKISHGLPIDSSHVLVAGVGPTGTMAGWELQLVLVNLADGTTSTFYEYDYITKETGITAELTLSKVADATTVVLQDAKGQLTTLDATGKVVATAATRCARTLNKGDVILCYSLEGLTLLSLPDLKQLSTIADTSNADLHLVGSQWVGQAGYQFLGYSG